LKRNVKQPAQKVASHKKPSITLALMNCVSHLLYPQNCQTFGKNMTTAWQV